MQFGGTTYDLDDPIQSVACFTAMGNVMATMNQTIATLQQTQQQAQAPQQAPAQPAPATAPPNPQQWQQLVNAITGQQAAPAAYVPPLNPAFPTGNVRLQHFAVPPDFKDIKRNKPAKWNSRRSDVESFVARFTSYINSQPNRFRLTQTRISEFCFLLGETPASNWADSVMKALNNNNAASSFYTDDWTTFLERFNGEFGILDKKADATNKFMHLVQGRDGWEAFFSKFEQHREDAGIDKDNAFYRLKIATNPALRDQMFKAGVLPRTYDAWATAAKERTRDARELKEFDHGLKYSSFTRPSPHHQAPVRDPDAMDIDAVSHQERRRKDKGKNKKPTPAKDKGKGRAPPPKKKSNHPSSSSSGAKAIPTALNPTTVRPGTFCYKCGGPGHFAASCKNPSPHKVQALVTFAQATLDQIPLGEEQEAPDASSEEEDNDVDDYDECAPPDSEVENLIDLDSDEDSNPF